MLGSLFVGRVSFFVAGFCFFLCWLGLLFCFCCFFWVYVFRVVSFTGLIMYHCLVVGGCRALGRFLCDFCALVVC